MNKEGTDTAAQTAVVLGDDPSDDWHGARARDDAEDVDCAPPPGMHEGALIGRYIVDARIGAGGMGVVFAAHDPQLNRRVAIKVLHADTRRTKTSERRARLIREAQAMAKLSHPHVVSVFDVGIHEGRVFLAMEFIAGVTLAEWLASRAPSVDSILDVVVQAGHGLAAAHAAGFAHRDFKPTNVMVDEGGRAHVMDFGLARGLEGDHSSTEGPRTMAEAIAPHSLTGDALTSPLTRAGVIMGTPAYMSPEQHLGRTPDARADQFSFCATVWEALQGERAYRANSIKELARLKLVVGPRECGRRIPAAIARVLRRGLSPEPERRYLTMSRLLDALASARTPAARWPWIAGLTLAALAAVALAPEERKHAVDPCEGQAPLSDLWSDARRDAIATAFDATAVPFAPDAWRSAQAMLGQYHDAWTEQHGAACVATRDGEQSGATLDLRMACLARGREALVATLDLFEHADRAIVERAVSQASSLPPLQACADVDGLRAVVAPPADPEVAAAVVALRVELTEVRAQEMGGHAAEVLTAMEDKVARARALGYAPLTAEALVRFGSVQVLLGKHREAEASWSEAAWMAAGAGADDVAADAATRLVYVASIDHADEGAAMDWARHARSWLGRRATDPLANARLDRNIGVVHSAAGRYNKAEEFFRRGYEAKRAILGERHPEVAGALEDIALALSSQGDLDGALNLLRASVEIGEEVLGPRHPDLGLALGNLGQVLDKMGRHSESFALYARAISIHEDAYGPEHPLIARGLDSMGLAVSAQARFAEARGYHERALALCRKNYGDVHPEVAWALGNLGIVADQMGAYEDALRYFDEALSILLEVYGEQHDAVGATHANKALALAELERVVEARREAELGVSMQLALLGHDNAATAAAINALAFVHYHEGDKEAALRRHAEALAIVDATLGPEHPQAAATLVDIAAVQRELSRPSEALLNIARALAILESNPVSPAFLASALFVKAEAQWDAGGDRTDAVAGAKRALSLYGAHDDSFAEQRGEIQQWLAHRS